MKKLIVIIAALLPIVVAAQQKSFTSFYNTYAERKGYTTVGVTGEMVKMMAPLMLDKANDPELLELLSNINDIKVVLGAQSSPTFVDDMEVIVKSTVYKLMTEVKKDGQQTRFYIVAHPTIPTQASELLMLSHGVKDNVVIDITGEIDLKKISKLSAVKIAGMEKLGGK